tara:strand:- start:2677 stop:3780 length:1104 start_codon:yes stop_codon:yes gene_type:complete
MADFSNIIVLFVVLVVSVVTNVYFFNKSKKDEEAKKEELAKNAEEKGSLKAEVDSTKDSLNKAEQERTRLESDKESIRNQLDLLKDQWKLEFEALRNIKQLLTQGGTKVGDIGETILETILESAGLQRIKKKGGVGQYLVDEKSGVDSDGKVQRPDILLFLPENKKIIIDSKLSLAAYSQFLNALSENAAKDVVEQYREAHCNAVENHIKALSKKSYHEHLDEGESLEMTVMFMASEGAYIEALRDLHQFSIEHKIAIVGPTTVMPIIKIVQMYWKIKTQNDNVAEVMESVENMISAISTTAKEYARMHVKLKQFLDEISKAGARLSRLNEKAVKMGKMGGIEVEEDHDINNLGLNDQSTINKESDK